MRGAVLPFLLGISSAVVVQPRCPTVRAGARPAAAAAVRHASCVRMQSASDLVTWFPPIDPSRAEEEPSEGATTMPLFPLGATCALPEFEPSEVHMPRGQTTDMSLLPACYRPPIHQPGAQHLRAALPQGAALPLARNAPRSPSSRKRARHLCSRRSPPPQPVPSPPSHPDVQ